MKISNLTNQKIKKINRDYFEALKYKHDEPLLVLTEIVTEALDKQDEIIDLLNELASHQEK